MVVSTFTEETGSGTYARWLLQLPPPLHSHTSYSTAETQAILTDILQLIHSFIKKPAERLLGRRGWGMKDESKTCPCFVGAHRIHIHGERIKSEGTTGIALQ